MLKGRASNERKHAKRRFLERFGFRIGTEVLQGLVQALQKGKLKHKRKQSNTRSLWYATIHEFPVIVVYDKNTKEIVTVMRPEEDDDQTAETP